MSSTDTNKLDRKTGGSRGTCGSLHECKKLGAHCPDFLRRLVALIHSMRLSLMKGAHADLSSTACQETGVKAGFGLSGIP
jgi:hypothetical protein